ncbi:SAM-dependent methyltransferase [Lactiplantibacillus pentosus]|nr:SAM-dependent methyltransferase [Lactiplantibacillus pentosus]MCT3296882.1 SAM-dependent methyltransferase [Lactiplantibacillus pentosus]MCT3301042.1 SAM-dependent methyltransferase [Lactiplantibacillus pentosus]MCT3314486.1 SAM-dependent methyltransferase [Lactiplantibacillus pentosus]MCT3329548.1 SAM-dependent methyltransferase [Lactiplantibacillus pentosus]
MKGVILIQLSSALAFSHALMNQVVNPGDHVIDATVGNGHDTVYLAKLVGTTGHVDGFDIQPAAIAATTKALTAAGFNHQATLWQTGHEHIADKIAADEPIKCAVFNLGYLPGGDKSIITKPTTTLTAIKAIQERLVTNGLIILLVYAGHPGGAAEAKAVLDYATSLDQHQFQVLQYQFVNQVHVPPYLLAIQKR